MRLEIPEFSLVAVIGVSGSGKSSFCRNHFLPTEVLSSDQFRAIVDDDETNQGATADAFDALHYVLATRLKRGRLTVVDATNVQKESRKPLLKVAEQYHALKVAIIIDTPVETCQARNQDRENRKFGIHVIRNQFRDLKASMRMLRAERWHKIYTIRPEDFEKIEVVREPMMTRRLSEHGPFDIIGDVHGCFDELKELLKTLGWTVEPELAGPPGRKLFFVGDLVDRGPDSTGVLKFVMDAVERGLALCVPGNHDIRLRRSLLGEKTSTGHGLAETLAQVQLESPEFKLKVPEFIHSLVSHLLVDDGKLCVAHAGMTSSMMGRGSAAVRQFALYGETTGEIDDFGLPVRFDWATRYDGKAKVVYGHVPVPVVGWVNNTIDIDSGCCFGGALTALRYPELEVVSVPALRVYAEPAKPIQSATPSLSGAIDSVLDISDVTGRRSVETSLAGRVTIREENAIAALETMSRFAADPRWLVYLPPTMSPSKASKREAFLEYPTDAFDYFRDFGVGTAVCEEKHMGSRAVAVICRDEATAASRFGVDTGALGAIFTRTGRLMTEPKVDQILVRHLSEAATSSGVFNSLVSDWVVLDMEFMPWSAKAIGLLREQYAPVGAAALASSRFVAQISGKGAARGIEGVDAIVDQARLRESEAELFVQAYQRYCWPVNSIEDFKLAPFHLLASEGVVHSNKSHAWHLEILGQLCSADPALLKQTKNLEVDLTSPQSVEFACEWWERLVGGGGEGMVVKPAQFCTLSGPKVIQPAIKCRGPEYLRIIYGPEYSRPGNLEKLRGRALKGKQSLALREFALGLEALDRLVRKEPLRRIHECVFGVLALESEPVDPRL